MPSGACSRGYYCPGGQDTPRPDGLACSPGHFCPEGSHNETGCPSGWYQQHWTRYDCEVCPRGAFCRAYGKHRGRMMTGLAMTQNLNNPIKRGNLILKLKTEVTATIQSKDSFPDSIFVY
uniref:TNFR-Cys domain-containing protein n=1 Tax=Anguilla anguilla TaxID=7936 RepID=A0A0E9SPT8_ANGAN